MKKLLILISILGFICSCSSGEAKKFHRNLKFIGMPIKGPLSKDGNYNEASYIISWEQDKIELLSSVYSMDPSMFEYYTINDDRIIAKIKGKKGEQFTKIYKNLQNYR